MIFRVSTKGDLQSLERIYPAAFPKENLLPVVRSLVTGSVDVLSLVAEDDGKVVGHVAFTICSVGDVSAALLAPLCVDPERHKQGIGTVLVREGFKRLQKRAINQVLVLGDPRYYGRFGFVAERAVRPPYPMPEGWADAWQSLSFGTTEDQIEGTLVVPGVWQNPVLWG
ncbi:GNAT family N-acetyltransferase [Roseibium alexandrii]|uniref:Acetyltransferase n=1 Tax=Roseibium alexandrii TaxID=388408 RepID=A0A0M7AGR4_9HYPH|nr:N-acetyltransferase [Roseibium alexandrii]CTQ74355.1 acetyltransferase [Roseibium alexandrii]